MPDQGRHGIVTFSVHAQIGGLSITHQQPLALEETAHAVGDDVCQLREFGMGRRLNPAKPRTRTCVIHIDANFKDLKRDALKLWSDRLESLVKGSVLADRPTVEHG